MKSFCENYSFKRRYCRGQGSGANARKHLFPAPQSYSSPPQTAGLGQLGVPDETPQIHHLGIISKSQTLTRDGAACCCASVVNNVSQVCALLMRTATCHVCSCLRIIRQRIVAPPPPPPPEDNSLLTLEPTHSLAHRRDCCFFFVKA